MQLGQRAHESKVTKVILQTLFILEFFSCSSPCDSGSLSNFCLFLLIAVHLRPKHVHNKSLQMLLEGQLKVGLHIVGVLEVAPEWPRLIPVTQSN